MKGNTEKMVGPAGAPSNFIWLERLQCVEEGVLRCSTHSLDLQSFQTIREGLQGV